MKHSTPRPVVLDFETFAIKPRPEYPPRPVGCAVRVPGEKPYYLAWGHPLNNNTTEQKATAVLRRLWNSGSSLLFHNAKFDYDVATIHLGLPELPWELIHDTLFLIFLQDPNRSTLSLKPVAEAVLNLPPNERDEVRAWLIEKGIVRSNDRKWGAHIADAPGDIVGRYAIGDVDRTFKLFAKYYGEVVKRGMQEAYNRERELMPELLRSERAGVAVDRVRLNRDVARYTTALDATDGWIRKRLQAPGLAVDADADLVAAIVKCGVGDETKWARTAKTGALSTAKDALHEALTDRALAGALTYRGVLATCTRTFMSPWAETAARSSGIIYTTWNQVAQDYHESGARVGARTGRLSSTPNFQNIPNLFEQKPIIVSGLRAMRSIGYLRNLLAEHPLPQCRDYIVAPKGSLILSRDYNQQELRILAHYESGVLLAAYSDDPWLDMHVFVQDMINTILEARIERKAIKTLNFGLIYGMGIGKLADRMGLQVETAKQIKGAHRRGIPGVSDLLREMKRRADAGEPIRTWGGREYYCEPPKTLDDGRVIDFDYKLLNTLIQGSAADNTKQAIVNHSRRRKAEGLAARIAINVHDELFAIAPREFKVREMRALRDSMQDVAFDVPMLSTGGFGTRWSAIKQLPKGE